MASRIGALCEAFREDVAKKVAEWLDPNTEIASAAGQFPDRGRFGGLLKTLPNTKIARKGTLFLRLIVLKL